MNTINHYVGMYPIATGGPVERHLAKFFFGMFAVMLIAFVLPKRKARVAVLAAGFAAVSAWMLVDQYMLGRLAEHMANYQHELGAFFREPAVIAERTAFWTGIAHGGVIATLLLCVVLAVVWRSCVHSRWCCRWCRRCCRSSSSASMRLAGTSAATTCIRWVPSRSNRSCRPFW